MAARRAMQDAASREAVHATRRLSASAAGRQNPIRVPARRRRGRCLRSLASPTRCRKARAMSSYRISSLLALPPSLDRTRFRKALSAMSVHTVSRQWLRREAGLADAEIDSLLALLDGAGVLLGP